MRADVRTRADVDRLIGAAVSRFGGVDILVNNAGIGTFANVADMSDDDWNRVLETNLTGVFYCCNAAIPQLRTRGGGWIINISSLAGKNAFVGGAAYCASKAGLNAFSEALMQEVRHDRIRVSYVMPGSVATEFSRGGSASGTDWKLASEDVAQVVMDLLAHPDRSLPSRVELRPSHAPEEVSITAGSSEVSRGRSMFAPGQEHRRAPAFYAGEAGGRGNRGNAGALGDQVVLREQRADGLSYRAFGHDHDAIHEIADDRPRDRLGIHVAAQAVGNRLADSDLDDVTGGARGRERRRRLDFDPDHLDARVHRLDRRCHAADQPASADRHQHGLRGPGMSSINSSPIVPAPAMTSGSLYGETKTSPVSRACCWASRSASS